VSTICVHCDSQLTIKKAQSSMYNSKYRYIHHKHNTIKHFLSNGIISIDYVKLKKNIMDSLTKSFSEKAIV
jgi:hypothetical protein